MRLIFPTAGTARILDYDIADISMRHQIGYLPENPYFYDYLTARGFLEYCGELFGYGQTERRKRASDLRKRVRLDEKRWDLQLSKVSKGALDRVRRPPVVVRDP